MVKASGKGILLKNTAFEQGLVTLLGSAPPTYRDVAGYRNTPTMWGVFSWWEHFVVPMCRTKLGILECYHGPMIRSKRHAELRSNTKLKDKSQES